MIEKCSDHSSDEIDVRFDESGTQRWFNSDGELHRTDGPAVVYSDGMVIWYLNGKRHRTDGPAMTLSTGTEYWYVNDELHRLDGPAQKQFNGLCRYFIHDVEYSAKEFKFWSKCHE